MNKKYLKENNLYKAHEQFMRLCEWSYVPKTLEEDDEQDGDESMQNQEPNNPMGDDNKDMSMNDDSQDMPMDDNQGMPMGDDNQDMPMNNGQDIPMDDNQGMSMDDGQGMPIGDDMIGGEDEEVIDVEDITNAQEKMNNKVNIVGQDLGKVNDKIEQLMKSLDAMESMINRNNNAIMSFQKEFEKRNPTQTEKLNLRSLDSYPFNVNPKDYWKDKGIDQNSNYSGYSNNDEPTSEENLEITNSDVDDFSEREIEDSFDITDDMNQTLKKIFNF